MSFWELFLIGVGLSMDAFAVSISKGLSVRRYKPSQSLCCGLWFGGFQMLMPLTGYLLGVNFQSYVESVAHWIAFVLLALIGGNMVRESFSDEEETVDASFAPLVMLTLAVATAIDALAVGVSFAALQVAILPAIGIIGATTFVISAAGVKIGSVFGEKYAAKAELAGGLILIAIGLKIVIEHYLG